MEVESMAATTSTLAHPLRNRVTPAGELIATEHRGTMYGNRGVLHNDDLVLVRRHQVRRWLVCVLEFRGRRRRIMQPRRYTELFFLDEAVALAAGHRPCAECRHADYQAFRTAWTAALGLRAKPAADDIDLVLHGQRCPVDGARVTYPARLRDLPDGVFIVRDDGYWLLHNGELRLWTPAGYTTARKPLDAVISRGDTVPPGDTPDPDGPYPPAHARWRGQDIGHEMVAVLTPRSTVDTIRAGYRPAVHISADPPPIS
jgi:hypothetical protein